MEKRVRIILAAVAGILVLLAGCSNALESSGETPIPAGKGRVEIWVENEARTALPSGSFDNYKLCFTYAGDEGYTHSDVVWSSGTSASVDLEPGNWTVVLYAYVGTTPSGTGSAAVTVNAGLVSPVTIHIGINTATDVKGTLKYTVSYPAGHSSGTQTLTVHDASGNEIGNQPITNETEVSLLLSPGVYFVGVVINDTALRIGAARTSVAHIYGGKDTSLEIEIDESDFTALVPLVVTADLTVSTGLTVSSRKVAAYRNAGCTDVLLAPEAVSLTGGAEIILWVPSADQFVYVRQEIGIDGIDGVTFNGKHVVVNITDPEQSVAESLNDSFYKVIISGLINGAVTSPAPIAPSGSSIALTVTPATDYILKNGTLKYNDGINDHPITGSAFTMPVSDVTISAFFNRVLGFTIEGPGDLMVPVTILHSDGNDSTNISWSQNKSITFTVNGSDYTIENEKLKWIVNGAEIITASGSSHTIHARDYVYRSYTVTVMIEEGGQWYSREIPFTVTK
jgi:hypothetical protein